MTHILAWAIVTAPLVNTFLMVAILILQVWSLVLHYRVKRNIQKMMDIQNTISVVNNTHPSVFTRNQIPRKDQ